MLFLCSIYAIPDGELGPRTLKFVIPLLDGQIGVHCPSRLWSRTDQPEIKVINYWREWSD
jgi:hypothetical protein